MQPLQHQMMGYDRGITMFSPDGRLLQVEYAKKTVRLGNTAIGMICKDGIILVVDKRIDNKLIIGEAVEKIFQIDDHVMATVAGIIADGRILVERAQEKAQSYRATYDSPIDILFLVKDICNLKQYCTQYGGLRPFGVSLLIAGIDETGKKLFQTDPTGTYNSYKATVIGEGDEDIMGVLQSEYSESMGIEDGLRLCLNAIKKFLGKDFNIGRIEASKILDDKKRMERISRDEINKIIKK